MLNIARHIRAARFYAQAHNKNNGLGPAKAPAKDESSSEEGSSDGDEKPAAIVAVALIKVTKEDSSDNSDDEDEKKPISTPTKAAPSKKKDSSSDEDKKSVKKAKKKADDGERRKVNNKISVSYQAQTEDLFTAERVGVEAPKCSGFKNPRVNADPSIDRQELFDMNADHSID